VFEQEEEVSQNFRLSNFYTNHRLNIAELKNRLEIFKRNHQPIVAPGYRSEHAKELSSDANNSFSTKLGAFSYPEAHVDK
jgi:hypothetical protein